MMQIIKQTDEEKMAMYLKCTKKELASMLIQCNKHSEALRQTDVIKSVCECVPAKGEEIGWYQKRHCEKCHKVI